MRPLSVADVRALAELTGKNWIVVIADREGGTQFVAWGRSHQDKAYASELSDHIGRNLCSKPNTVVESFVLDAARNKVRVEELEGIVEELVATFKDVLPFAEAAVKTLNQHMTPGLHPAISEVKIEMAHAALARAKGVAP